MSELQVTIEDHSEMYPKRRDKQWRFEGRISYSKPAYWEDEDTLAFVWGSTFEECLTNAQEKAARIRAVRDAENNAMVVAL